MPLATARGPLLNSSAAIENRGEPARGRRRAGLERITNGSDAPVGNGLRGYHYFGEMGTSPKSVRFGEVAPGRGGLEARWIGLKLEGRERPRGLKGSRRRLGAERKRLRVRGLAVGSSQLPWAQHPACRKSGARQGARRPRQRRCLLKGCEKPFRPTHPQARYCSPECRAAARRWRRQTSQPAVSAEPPTVGKNARLKAGGIDAAAPSAGGQAPSPGRRSRGRRTSRVRDLDVQPSRGPAPSRRFRIFLLRSSGVRRAFHTPSVAAPASGFAAPPAVRLCGG